MTSHKLVSEGLVYGCSEIINETFCFYMVQNIPGLSIHKGQKQESDEALDDLKTCSLSSTLLHMITSILY